MGAIGKSGVAARILCGLMNLPPPPAKLDSPEWALAFSRHFFQSSRLLASVLQFLVLRTRRSFSRSSIHLRFDLPFFRVPIGWTLKTLFSGAVFIHSDNVTCPFNSL
ncbi:hypothetical protein TNCV_2027551 [Trichonephila clavipes]|nr:hypothetical protein TNCV_2027551 [Trichonephila clavipes]